MVNTGSLPSATTRFRHARYYITFRCNARCGYCNVWQDPVFFGQSELDTDGILRCIDQLHALGVTYVDFTGGEPALHASLPRAVRHAAELGLTTEVTSNAIRFDRTLDEIAPYVTSLNISIDTLSAERYHAIRGTDTLDRTIALVDRARRDHPDVNLKLISVISKENVGELDEVTAFAQQNQVPVYLSPMFDYFAGQRTTRDPLRTGRSLHLARVNGRDMPGSEPVRTQTQDKGHAVDVLSEVRRRVSDPFTMVNLGLLRHLETLDPDAPTACSAGTRIVTVGPEGQLMLPCYHEWNDSLRWERPYHDLVADPRYTRVARDEVGLLPGCRRCSVYPYLGLEISHRYTPQFLTQAISEELSKIKLIVNRGPGPAVVMDDPWPDLLRLLERVDGQLLRPGTSTDARYLFEAVPGRGIVTDLAAGEAIAVEELLSDHAGQDCWRVQRGPHRLLRCLYAEVTPALLQAAAAGDRDSAALLRRVAAVHLALWQVLLDLLGAAGESEARDRSLAAWWCGDVARVLRARPQAPAAAIASVNGLGLLMGLSPDTVRRSGGLDADPERLLVLKFARRLEGPPDLSDLHTSPAATPGYPDPEPRTSSTEPSPASLTRAAQGDEAALGELCGWVETLGRDGGTEQLRSLIDTWNRCVDATVGNGNAHDLQERLLAHELGRLSW